MIYIIGLLAIVCLILIITCATQSSQINELKQSYSSQWEAKMQESHRALLKSHEDELKRQQESINAQLEASRRTLQLQNSEFEQRRMQIAADLELALKSSQDQVAAQQAILEQLKESTQKASESQEENYLATFQEQARVYQEGLEEFNRKAQEEMVKLREQIECIDTELFDYQRKREAMNKDIIRQREMEEKEDFYKVQLTPENLEDIEIFNSIRGRVHKSETLNKMIYDNYISKPTKEMVKRVVGSTDRCGIYKITNTKTKEAYVGKSVHIGERWSNHIKTACGLDGVADSQFQRALKKYGIENWTFEIIEEVNKTVLSDREKYWIDFYGTKEYGLNERMG